jgi:HAMP domain-containing protein
VPTIIDSLVVQLGLDASKYKSGQKEAVDSLKKTRDEANRTAKEMQVSGVKAAEFYGAIKTEVLGLIGTLAGAAGLAELVKNTTREMSALGRAAQHIGSATPQVAAFANAIGRNGGSVNAATQSLIALTDALEQYRIMGNSPMAPFLSQIGADRADGAIQVLEKFQKYAEEHKGDVPLINFTGHGLGLDQGTINAVVQMQTVGKLMEEVRKSYENGVPSEEDVKRMQKLQHDWLELQQTASKAASKIVTDLQPALSSLLTWAEGATKELNDDLKRNRFDLKEAEKQVTSPPSGEGGSYSPSDLVTRFGNGRLAQSRQTLRLVVGGAATRQHGLAEGARQSLTRPCRMRKRPSCKICLRAKAAVITA